MGSTTVYRSTKGMTTRALIESELPTTLTQNGRIVASGTGDYHDGEKVFYAAVEDTDGTRWALVVLYKRAAESFWYKEMDETVGPVAQAPRNVMEALAGSEPHNEYAAEWRRDCWAHLARKERAKAVKAGDLLRMPSTLTFGWRGGETFTEDTFRYVEKDTFRAIGANTLVRLTGWKGWAWEVLSA